MAPKVSICIASRNHAPLLERTLDSIFKQYCQNNELEVIVTDDGSTDETPKVLDRFPVKRLRRESKEYRNGVFAKNSSLREATGDVIIQQSDDVIHATPNAIEELVRLLSPGYFLIANVYDWDFTFGRILQPYTGIKNPRPLFFLGSCWREDVCKVGGYDPEFSEVISYDDNWHSDGLMHGLGLKWSIVPSILGLHQSHHRPNYNVTPAKSLYEKKVNAARLGHGSWLSSAGRWPYVQGRSVNSLEAGS
jgi:glycosyltransferase involved in cell wall biosynthesis